MKFSYYLIDCNDRNNGTYVHSSDVVVHGEKIIFDKETESYANLHRWNSAKYNGRKWEVLDFPFTSLYRFTALGDGWIIVAKTLDELCLEIQACDLLIEERAKVDRRVDDLLEVGKLKQKLEEQKHEDSHLYDFVERGEVRQEVHGVGKERSGLSGRS